MDEHDTPRPDPAAPAPPPAASRRIIVGPEGYTAPGPAAAVGLPPRRRITPLDIGLVLLSVVLLWGVIWVIGQATAPAAAPAAPAVAQKPAGAGAAATSAPAASDAKGPPTPLPAGTLAPDFSLPAPDGKTYSLSQFRGKIVLLEFMAPWCPHCQNTAGDLNTLYAKYAPLGVEFLSVSATPLGHTEQGPISMDDMTWFRDTYHVTYPLLLDAASTIGTGQYSVTGYPFIYLIDAQGRVISHPGFGAQELAASLDHAVK